MNALRTRTRTRFHASGRLTRTLFITPLVWAFFGALLPLPILAQTSPTIRVDSYSALANVVPPTGNPAAYFSAIVGGASTNGDTGGGIYTWNAVSTQTTNGSPYFRVIAHPYGSATGRWSLIASQRNALTNSVTGSTPLTANIIPLVDASGTNLVNSTFTGNGGVISGSGASTVQAAGQLDLKTTAGNANVVLTPNGTGFTLLNGNVGIGTTTPSDKLQVYNGNIFANGLSTDVPAIGFRETGIIKGYIQYVGSGSGITGRTGDFEIETVASVPIVFRPAVSEAMRITSSGNVGIGTTNANSTETINGSFATSVATGGSVTLGASNYSYFINASAQTITLPTAIGITGRIYVIKLIVAGTGTVATSLAQTIDGAASYSLSAQNKYVNVQSDGANWQIIGNN